MLEREINLYEVKKRIRLERFERKLVGLKPNLYPYNYSLTLELYTQKFVLENYNFNAEIVNRSFNGKDGIVRAKSGALRIKDTIIEPIEHKLTFKQLNMISSALPYKSYRVVNWSLETFIDQLEMYNLLLKDSSEDEEVEKSLQVLQSQFNRIIESAKLTFNQVEANENFTSLKLDIMRNLGAVTLLELEEAAQQT